MNTIRSELEKTLDSRIFEYFLGLFRKQQDSDSLINFNLITDEEIAEHFDRTRDKAVLLLNRLNESGGSRIRRTSIMETTEAGPQDFFESGWLTTISEKVDKKMIEQYEKTIRRKVTF